MAKYFVFTYEKSGITARARLLEDQAPETCRILWERLPFEGECFHAIYSGTTAALLIDPTIIIPVENSSNLIQKSDLMFTHYDHRQRHGHPDALSEIYWAYDRYCSPRAPGQMAPVYPNIFGEFLPGCEEFFEASRCISTEGPASIRVTGSTED